MLVTRSHEGIDPIDKSLFSSDFVHMIDPSGV